MKGKNSRLGYLLLAAMLVCVACAKKPDDPISQDRAVKENKNYTFPLSLQKEMESSLKRAYGWLKNNQAPNGAWKQNPAITALVLYGLLEGPGNLFDADVEKAILQGYAYLDGFLREDGSIYANEYRNYTTAVGLLALAAFENLYQTGKYKAAITKAKDFLIEFQLDESENIPQSDPFYGGIGYGGDTRPDLSNTQLALDAIKAAEDLEMAYQKIVPENQAAIEEDLQKQGLHWGKALVFLARCQNLEDVNTMDYRTLNDGGFMYETGTYKEDRSHSYGSMTYAGVKSLLYADVAIDDIRVVKAVEWIKQNYTLEENPGFENTSLYYYYMTVAKCLDVMQLNLLTDDQGTIHYWREELVKKVLSLQKGDGYWVNDDGRYWENMPELATAYSLAAMKYALKGLGPDDIK